MNQAPDQTTEASMVSMSNPDLTPDASSRRMRWLLWLGMFIGLTAVVASVAGLRGGTEPRAIAAEDVPYIKDGKLVYSTSFKERARLADAVVEAAPLTPVVSAVGIVTFDPRHVARVGTRLRGVVHEVNVFEGAHVKRGQRLAQINSPELAQAQAQVSMLRAQAEAAQSHAARQKGLVAQCLATARDAERALAEEQSTRSMLHAAEQKVAALAGGPASHQLGIHTLVAPLEGTVVERHVTQGELVDGDEVAFVVARLDHLWVELDVYERNLAAIAEGDRVTLEPLGQPDRQIQGHVAHVGSVLDARTRSAQVRIEIDNPHHELRPGQAVDAKIWAKTQAREATVVPSDAITYVDGRPTVFVCEGPLSVRPVTVELGESDGKRRQILSGITPGQRVITRGVFELKSELFR